MAAYDTAIKSVMVYNFSFIFFQVSEDGETFLANKWKLVSVIIGKVTSLNLSLWKNTPLNIPMVCTQSVLRQVFYYKIHSKGTNPGLNLGPRVPSWNKPQLSTLQWWESIWYFGKRLLRFLFPITDDDNFFLHEYMY